MSIAVVLLIATYTEAGSLYEYYTSTSADKLREESREMGKELAPMFSQESISIRQKKIDFAEYFANLKKLVVYATKLSTYSEYEKDLLFARDHEVFMGLPDEPAAAEEAEAKVSRHQFVEKKYGQMKINVQEEIGTYVDLIQMSLDVCETMTEIDLSGFSEEAAYRNQVIDFTHGDVYGRFQNKQAQFSHRWPDLASRIENQLDRWPAAPPKPNEPIIDTKVAGAI